MTLIKLSLDDFFGVLYLVFSRAALLLVEGKRGLFAPLIDNRSTQSVRWLQIILLTDDSLNWVLLLSLHYCTVGVSSCTITNIVLLLSLHYCTVGVSSCTITNIAHSRRKLSCLTVHLTTVIICLLDKYVIDCLLKRL